MRRSWCCLFAACSLFSLTGMVAANDSGPGPINGATSQQYNVIVIRASGFEQGTFTFTGSGETSPDTETDGNEIDDGTPVNPDTGAGNDPAADTTNPTATGDFGNVGTGGTTNGGTTTGGTTTGGTTTGGTTGATSDPPSYWTRARVNGQVASQTNDTSSSNYWTRARANGQGVSADAGGNVDDGETSAIARGTITVSLEDQSTTGNWYSVDLGGFSLWYATANSAGSASGNMTFAGYATPEIIVGRMANSSGGMLEAMFNGSFFVGQAAGGMEAEDTDSE
jgi:hypothetical protein